MHHDALIGQIQHQAALPSRGDAERVTRIVLETLSELLTEGAARHLAAQLPPEIGRHLVGNPPMNRVSLDEFHQLIKVRERATLDAARGHVRAVLTVVCAAVTPGVVEHVRVQLPAEFGVLFGHAPEPRPAAPPRQPAAHPRAG